MNRYYYKKSGRKNIRLFVRIVGICLSVAGVSIVLYIFSPLIIWQLTIAPVYASQHITAPIPKHILVSPGSLGNFLATELAGINTDYTNAQNWYPGFSAGTAKARVQFYTISIPKLGITNAIVSTIDSNLAQHLVQLTGTPVAPERGTTVVFGHSTLPQLFNQQDYKTILANAYQLQTGDTIDVTVEGVVYTYKIYSILIVDPNDTSVLAQNYDDSYFTLITCTPPGTVWERQVIQARLEKI